MSSEESDSYSSDLPPLEIAYISTEERANDQDAGTEDVPEKEKRREKAVSQLQEALSFEEEDMPDGVCIFSEPPAPYVSDLEVDPELEHSLWVERETRRIKEEVKLEAIEELEKLKNERMVEIANSKMAQMKKESRGKMRFMQKYYHKGAFVKDFGGKSKDLSHRSATEATGYDLIDKTILPKHLSVRGDEIFKKGKSKWTHMANEDTTNLDMDGKRRIN